MSLRLISSSLTRRTASSRHRHYSNLSERDSLALNTWINHITTVSRRTNDTCSPSQLSALYSTLPTRSPANVSANIDDAGPAQAAAQFLGYGHSLAFFGAHAAETDLRADGTDGAFCPPAPFTRRMWASGAFAWRGAGAGDGLRVGHAATATARVLSVEQKHAGADEKGPPMVFVQQRITYTQRGLSPDVVLSEDRTHVYLPSGFGAETRDVKEVKDLPRPDFSYAWTPTPTTLFRFSALMFNAHLIHLDKEYAQKHEGYPERLVHGPLTALMLLEALVDAKPGLRLKAYKYRALNPAVVSKRQTIHGSFVDDGKSAILWAVDDDGVVGMKGLVDINAPLI